MPESRFPPIAILPLLIASLCIYGIILHPNLTFAGMDFLNLGYPRVFQAREAFLAGHFPLWNWLEWGGAPLLATSLGAILYPPAWIAMALPLPYGLQAFVFVHLFSAGLGTAMLARKIFRMTPSAAVFCGIVYMGSSFFPGRLDQFQVIAVNSYLPWTILAAVTAWHSWRAGLWLPAVWALTLLAGHPQFALFNILTALTVMLALNSRELMNRNGLRTIGRIALLLIIGTGLACIQLFPTFELGSLSERIWPYPEPTLPELTWRHLPALLIPRYYGMIGHEISPFGVSELGLYAGLATMPLAVYGAIAGLRTPGHRRVVIIAITLWLGAMWFALGRNGGIASLVFDHVPFFKNSRGAARSLNIATLMLAILAGYGLMQLLQTRWIPNRRPLAIASVVIAVIILDLAAVQYRTIRPKLVATSALNHKPLIPQEQHDNLTDHSRRMYRFMAYDSDIYLNNSPAGVAERHLRAQPNLNTLNGLPLLDGYEEGLLPTRNIANLYRRFNRNLRTDSPDAALLAMLQSNFMMTEFPLPLPDENWQRVSADFPRPAVVPASAGHPTAYSFWQSSYDPALFADLDRLTSDTETFLVRTAEVFPLNVPVRMKTSRERTPHPFEHITPNILANATRPFTQNSGFSRWNSVTARLDGDTTRAIVAIPPYPGWKATSKNNASLKLKHLCSIFYVLQVTEKDSSPVSLNLIFQPYSFRLGLFVTLLASGFYLWLLLSHFKPARSVNVIVRDES